jgi:hypothetical protein
MTRRRSRDVVHMADRKRRVREAWERIEDAEPDISTERLMAMVANDTGEDYGDVVWLIDSDGPAS